MVPIFALAFEHDPDPEMRPYPEPMNDEQRLELIAAMAAGAMKIFRYFEQHRRFSAQESYRTGTYRRDAPKVGRNLPCPCGSGKKYKKCCRSPKFH